jgi:nitrogen fixation protein FixH
VNARFIYIAVQTFPGAATADDFDTSNQYDSILAAAAAQASLGWTEQASTQGAVAVVDITGPDNHALAGAIATAQAKRPLGPDMQTVLTFHETAQGHYVATATLPRPGQWDLALNVAQGGHTAHVTRRIVVR